jgi:hypothetical protein
VAAVVELSSGMNSKHFFANAISCGQLERAGAVMNRENLKNNSDYDSLESEDMKLRQSINTLARKESTLLDVGAAAEIQKEIQNRVMLAIKASAKSLEEQSGVKPSLTDTEIRNHLKMVVQELRDTK